MTAPDIDQCCAPDGATEPGMCGCEPGCDCSCISCPCADDTDWFDKFPVKCRHCGAEIALAGTEWIDRQTGFTACVKGQVKAPEERPSLLDVLHGGATIFTPPVPHEPMPAGLEGAPPDGYPC